MTNIVESDRRMRYSKVLQSIRNRDSFTSNDLHTECREENPGFITRLLNQLAVESVLKVIETNDGRRFNWKVNRESFSSDAWIDQQLCGSQITQSPIAERPRERLLHLGAENLKTAELLAILIRTGRRGESALQAGEKIANRANENLKMLRGLSPVELKQISSVVSEAAYCQIMAGIELGRRIAESMATDPGAALRIDSSAAAIAYCRRLYARLAMDGSQEEFHIVTLDTKLQPIGQHQITVGTLDASLVSPREVFRPAIRDAAAAILLIHNHPSGDPTPSRQDFQVTRSLDAAAKIIGIQVIDHIVVASKGAVSIRELGEIG